MRYQANTRYHSIRWILAYAGIFFLGFGGSRSTSEMAINYYKTVRGRGIAVSPFAMVLLVGIGKTRPHSGIASRAQWVTCRLIFRSGLRVMILETDGEKP